MSELLEAVENNNIKKVRELLKAGADINFQGKNGYSALCISIVNPKSKKISKLLIDSGADINVVTSCEITPLYLAVEISNLEIFKLLLEKGANPNTQDCFGESLLHEAVREYSNAVDEIKKLIKKNL